MNRKALSILAVGFLCTGSVSAATFTVNATVDAVDATPGDGACVTAAGMCSLRAAVQEANALTGADTIMLSAGTYTFAISGRDEQAAASGDLDITQDLTITGAVAATTIIDAASLDRVLHIQSGAINVAISGVSIINGNPGLPDGAGILHASSGSLSITDSIIRNNVSGNSIGGGINHFGTGSLTVTNTTVRDNQAANGAGIYIGFSVRADATITNSVIANNVATFSGGGIQTNQANVLLTGTRIENNRRAGTGSGGAGGGIITGNSTMMRIVNCTIIGNSNNSFNFGGGGIYNLGQLTVEDSVISNNSSDLPGGGMANSNPGAGVSAILIRTRVESNSGGGIFNGSQIGINGTLRLEDSVINANSGGAGLINSLGSTATLLRTTISRNTGGGVTNSGAVTLENVTISNNVRTGEGGGVYNIGNATLNNVTIVENRTETGPFGGNNGGGIFNASGQITLRNTIVARNSDADGSAPDCGHDLVLTINSDGNNLIQNPAPCTFTGTTSSNITGVDPMIGPLANNGGPTETHALLTGSPAIDRGSGCPATDQRGITRPLDGNGDGTAECDIGAFETPAVVVNNPVPTIASLDPSSATAGSGPLTLIVPGTNFVAGSEVRFNGASRTTTFVSSTELRATIPASDLASPGTATVTVFNPAPGGGTSNALMFTISPAAPIPALSPIGLLLLALALAGAAWIGLSKLN